MRLPSSSEQKRLCLLEQLDAEHGTYNVSARFLLRGSLQPVLLQQAYNTLIARHEILRTSLHMHGGELTQIVRRELTGAIVIAPRASDEAALTTADVQAPLALSIAPLVRVTLFRRTQEEHVLLVTAHPAILDHCSIGLLVEELAQVYSTLARGEESDSAPAPRYAEFVSLQAQQEHGADYDAHLNYWSEKLKYLPQFEVLTDRPRTGRPSSAGDEVSLPLAPKLVAKLRDVCAARSTSLFELSAAAVQVLLHRFTGERDVVVGTQVSARRRAELERMLGPAENTALLVAELDAATTLRQVLQAAQQALAAMRAHQDLPLESVLENPDLRRGQRGPLFTVNLSFRPELLRRTGEFGSAALECVRLPLGSRRARYELEFVVDELDNQLQLGCIYRTELFERETIERMLSCLSRILQAFAENLDTTVGDVPLISAEERQKVLSTWNSATAAPYPQNQCVHELIEAQVERTPDAIAAKFGTQRVTYRDFNACANQLARHLQVNGVRPGDHVGIALERSLEMLTTVLAVMKAGATYVPLDPAYPKERLGYMMKDAKLRALVTQRTLRNEVATAGINVVCIDDEAEEIAGQPTENLNLDVDSGRCVYILYTSGSTGAPKGVQISHRCFVNLLCSVREITGLAAHDVMLAVTTLCFDISGAELILPLTVGAQVVIAPREVTTDVRRLSDMITSEQITAMQATPALWRMLVDSGWSGARHLTGFSCGEAVTPDLAVALATRTAVTWNWYGPTETTVYSTVSRLTGPRVTIGRPLANTQIYIVDEKLRPQPIGVPGELYIGGDGVGLGYLNRPDLTAERFTANPYSSDPAARWYRTGDRARFLSSGEIEFLGRSDEQLKVRGFRIEPGEIEAVLREHSAVQSCVVAAHADAAGDKRLVAYVVTKDRTPLRSPELRTFLARKLPEYMLPNAFVSLKELPLTPSGKINRRALPAPESFQAANVRTIEPANNPIEAELIQIWEDLLQVRPIGINDDFFALGGHSLLAVRMMSMIERVYRRRIPVAAFVEAPRVERLAAALLKHSETSRETPLIRIKEGTKPPFYFMHGDILGGGLYCWNLARQVDPERPLYLIPPQGLESDPLLPSIEAIAAYHLQFIREIQPHGPYYLGGTCNGGIIALETAQQLRAAGEDVAALVIIDAPPDNAQHRFLHALVRLGNWLSRRTPAQAVKSFRRWRARTLRWRSYLRRSPQEHLSRSTRRLRKIFSGKRKRDDSSDLALMLRDSIRTPEGRQALLKYYRGLLEGYVPQRYEGRVDLLFSREPGEAEDLTATDKLWFKIVREPRIQFITGRHATFTTRNLPALAECLDRALG